MLKVNFQLAQGSSVW